MINQDKISSLLQDAGYYLVNIHYDNIIRSSYALSTNDDYKEHEIQCLRLLIKSLSREYQVDYTSNICQELYLKLANIIDITYLDDYIIDDTLSISNQTIIVINNIEDVQNEIDAIYIILSDLQDQINNLDLETSFIELTDTPDSYLNQSGKTVIVNEDETALEFIDFPSSETTETVISDVIVGAVETGDSIPSGTDIQELVNLIFNKTFFPVLNAPTFSLSNNAGLREIGQLSNFTITFNYNRGTIVLQGVTQNSRSGTAIDYEFRPLPIEAEYVAQSGNIYSVSDWEVLQGINNFAGKVNYNEGPQPLDSKGNNFDNPYPAGTSSVQTTSFEGVYPLFATTVNITTATKQTLVSMLTANNIQINLVAESGGNKQFFDIPDAWLTLRPLTSIQYFNPVSGQFDTVNRLSEFTVTSVNQTIQGNTVGYKRRTFNGIDRGAVLIRLIF